MPQNNLANIAQSFISTGILQLGYFVDSNNYYAQKGYKPYRWRLEMLPAYPELLKTIASIISPHIQDLTNQPNTRLITISKTTPIGVILAAQMAIPLVYSQSGYLPPIHDFVGAYDVGHPSCLLIDEATPHLDKTLNDVLKIGLDVQKIVSVVGKNSVVNNIPLVSILDWNLLLETLIEQNFLTSLQLDVILKSIQQ